ncbi:hypothetical protein FAUST_8606 [Fusarium austroamericanum]|uniref:Heterokaryon incompatibility domain-containing protein n=1 Tax=Fusarium austroamericanum TaxID=282268 RepID=A0AAN6BXC7_FUSAU|nr:hypothetical protein FAUST_8606 [Fusarium austroamericanum]
MTDVPQVRYETPEWVANCETCKPIWQRLTSGDELQNSIDLGSYKDPLPGQCPHFKPIVQALDEYSKGRSENENDLTTETHVTSGGQEYTIDIHKCADTHSWTWNLALVDKESMSHHPGTTRILDPEWADMTVLNTWKDACISSHGASCQNPLKIWHTRPAWLIDVEQKCLVPGDVGGTYVALSYTYGNHVGRLIDASILTMFQLPDALKNPTLSGYVSPIIRNAMFLTAAIGERYLWADAICITHEDKESTTRQLNSMGAIYANAIVTIMAADGDSLTGLAGIKGISAARELEQQIVPFEDQVLLRIDNFGLRAEDWLPYYERGWIYQELRLSTRKIVFHKEQLHWMCRCAVWHEESAQKLQTEMGSYREATMDSSLSTLFAGFFDWSAFNLAVTWYNGKTFRYDEDAFPAISGFLSVLSRHFKGGFLYGIPEMMFERGLGWTPSYPIPSLERRTRSSRPQSIQLKPSGLPSWSWIGWSGGVRAGYNEATLVSRRYDRLEETAPITKWYTSHSPTDPPELWRRIRSTWYENRSSYKDFTKPLPPGWTRYKAPDKSTWNEGPHLFPDGCEEYIFKHESMPVKEPGFEEEQGWYYPFPVAEVDESTLPNMPEQTDYLFCRTKKAQLWGIQKKSSFLGTEEYEIWDEALLYNSQKQEVGFLDPVSYDYQARLPKTVTDGERGFPVDLVSVCKIRTYSRTQDQVTKIWDKTTKDTYLVLWVEWKAGIAYRLGSGQVQVDKWDELDLEDISLILG